MEQPLRASRSGLKLLNKVSFREKPTPGGHFVPKWHQFPGRNATRAPKEILLSPNEVSFREKPTPGGHFVPKWHQFPGETHYQRALCPQMASVSGRDILLLHCYNQIYYLQIVLCA